MDWAVFVVVATIFGLKTALTMFQCIITEIFGEFIPAFMQVFLNDFAVYGAREDHLGDLWLCLERCRPTQFSLNLAKCAFSVTSRALLMHIIYREGIAVDPGKIKAIIEVPAPRNANSLSHFLGQIHWHSHMLHYLANFTTLLHAAMHHTPFNWTIIEDKAYMTLKPPN